MALNPTASQGRLNSAIRPQRISTRNITSWKAVLAVRMPSVLMSPPNSGRAPSRRMAPSAHPTRKIPPGKHADAEADQQLAGRSGP